MNPLNLAQTATEMPASLDTLMIIIGAAYAMFLLPALLFTKLNLLGYAGTVVVLTLSTGVFFGEQLYWLATAIDDINQTSLEQFKVTFEQIRKNFAYTFNILFGGGRAEIDLVTAEDPLESGIEIVAQPPGTKLKGITLLSGGQKTLTAVALLFALYMVKPSPFCLLDELDAPLDESNIHRFTNLLKQFVKESQFIIITHNKSTVAAADALYGVTMQERGVSKTVSMRFNKERGEAEALPTTIADSVRGARPQAPVGA